MTELVEQCLAVWRLTHLIVEDSFPPIQRARDAVFDRLGPDHPVSYLLSCHFCTGVWVGAAAAVARKGCPRLWRPVRGALAAAAAAPLIEAALNRMEVG